MTTESTRHRWPLNFTPSKHTPGYYSRMEKPLFLWTLDDVLESAQNNPAIEADADAVSRRLAALDEQQAQTVNHAVRQVMNRAAPQLTTAASHLARQVMTLTQLLASSHLAIAQTAERHPEPGDRFPEPDEDESIICLHRPIFAFTLMDVYRQQYPNGVEPRQMELQYLNNLNDDDRAAYDAVIDVLCQEHDELMAKALHPVNEKVYQTIKPR